MASFLDDLKSFGLVAMIVGVVMAVSGILTCIGMNGVAGAIFTGIGQILYAAIIILLGLGVYTGGVKVNLGPIFSEGLTSKFGILTAFVGVTGLGQIITGLFSAIQVITTNGNVGAALSVAIVGIILGLICLVFAYLMKDGKTSISDKIIFIILAIIFLIFIIIGLLNIISFTILGIIYGIAIILMYLMLFLYLISPEVKSKLGM